MDSIGSWSMTVVLSHCGSVRVVATTYLGSAFMPSLSGSPERADHTGANSS
jgi:hypothetical protein